MGPLAHFVAEIFLARGAFVGHNAGVNARMDQVGNSLTKPFTYKRQPGNNKHFAGSSTGSCRIYHTQMGALLNEFLRDSAEWNVL